MYTVVDAVRTFLGYALFVPVVVVVLAVTLLSANILTSYWFQRRREHPVFQQQPSSTKARPLSPTVQQITRLAFASHLSSPKQSLYPTPYNTETWQDVRVQINSEAYSETEQTLSTVIGLVVRDFVQAWFRGISADPSFPRCVQTQIIQSLETIIERTKTLDVAEFAVGQLVPLVTVHLRSLRESNGSESQFLQSSKCHRALTDVVEGTEDVKKAVMRHVRRVVDLVVPLVLPAEQSGLAPHRTLVREIMAGALLTPVVQSLSDPDTINQLLDGQLARLIREQHMVSELREVLDKQAADEWAAKEAAVEEDAGGSTVVTYDEFMRNIEGCSDAEELARIRDEILAQIRKKRILIMGQNKDDIVHGQRVRDVLVYINRLYVAKKKAERRLDLLHIDRAGSTTVTRPRGNSASSARSTLQPPSIGVLRARPSTYYEHRDDPVTLGPPQFTLYEILTNVGSLSAFAEFADQLGHGMLVEFWLNVEGIRQQPVTISIVESLWKGYFTVRVDELASVGEDTAAAVSEVQKCLKPWRASNSMELKADEIPVDVYERAFELVCEVQANVLRFLEEKDYPAFQRSVLYSRFLRSYVVTPRQEQISDTLFANIPNNQSQSQTAEPRQLSLVRSMPESTRQRSVSGSSLSAAGSSAESSLGVAGRSARRPSVESENSSKAQRKKRWSFAPRRARPVAIEADTAAAVVVHRNESASSIVHMEQPTNPPAAVDDAGEIQAMEEYLQPTRRPARVGRSEVRRLSASLRSIALNDSLAVDGAMAPMDLQMEPLESDPDEDLEEETDHVDEVEEGEEAADSEQALPNADEAESLVIARAIKNPAPGDLFLDQRVAQLIETLSRKTHQMAIVKALMKQATSRHKPHEQRVLSTSLRDLRREVLTGVEQQRLYESCMDEHTLSNRTLVHIPRAIATHDDTDQPHTVYLIELQQTIRGAEEPHALTGWVVARRYREFFNLHRELRALMPNEMRAHEVPARAPLTWLQKKDIEVRRVALERYIAGLVRDSELCKALPLREFLSAVPPPATTGTVQSGSVGWMAQIHKTVNEDLEGITGAESMLDMLVQELSGQVALQTGPATTEPALFVDPLSDIFIEVFGLGTRRNWLRKQAISILLRHILGGTVERRVRDSTASLLRDQMVAGLLGNLRQSLWPQNLNGGFAQFQGFRKRTQREMEVTESEARERFLWYVPRVLGNMVGKKNATVGAKRVFEAVQLPTANLNLVLLIFDAAVAAVFPEIRYQLES